MAAWRLSGAAEAGEGSFALLVLELRSSLPIPPTLLGCGGRDKAAPGTQEVCLSTALEAAHKMPSTLPPGLHAGEET